MSSVDYAYATALELVKWLDEGAVSAFELTEAAIARIERLDPNINAVCVRDFERAREAAREADRGRTQGRDSPLLGVPMLIKESFNVAGLPTTWGIPPFKDFVVDEDAVAVAQARAAGAIILGKTNVPVGLGDLQSYNPIYGVTNNPWDAGRTPGGSSGGSAAALAAGYVPLSIGSDIAGSLRVPAHFCGIYAHKPSYGILPTRGHAPPPAPPILADRDLAVVGPMARSAADLSLLFDLLVGLDERGQGKAFQLQLPPARGKRLEDYRVLILDTHPAIPNADSVQATIEVVAAALERRGAVVRRQAAQVPDLEAGTRLYLRLLLSAIAANYPPDIYEMLREQALQLTPTDRSLAAERLRGAVLSHRGWVAADTQRAQLRWQWQSVFADHDVVVCPISPTPAFHHDSSPNQWVRKIDIDGKDYDYADQLVWSGIATAPGLPAAAIPAGRDARGLPIGVQLIGPMYEDRTTLHLAGLLEEELGGFVAPFA